MKVLSICIFIVAAICSYAQSSIGAEDALKLAATNRPALSAAKQKISQAQALAKSAGAYPATTLSIGASSRSEIGSTDQDLQLSQSLDLFGRRGAGRKVGEAGVLAATAEYKKAAIDLQNDVLAAFAETVASQHRRSVSAELLSISEELYKATKRRFDEGKVAEIQVTRASIELERAKQFFETSESEYLGSLEVLAGFVGIESANLTVAADAQLEPLNGQTFEARPDLMILASEVKLAEAEAAVSRASNRPELSFQVMRSPWSNDPGYFAGRLQLSWAVMDHGKARNEDKAAKHKADSARKSLEDATKKAKTEVKAAQILLDSRKLRVEKYGRILESARDLVAKSQKGFSEGFGTLIDVLEAARALREVEQELIEARQQLSMAVIAQYKASGYLSEVLK